MSAKQGEEFAAEEPTWDVRDLAIERRAGHVRNGLLFLALAATVLAVFSINAYLWTLGLSLIAAGGAQIFGTVCGAHRDDQNGVREMIYGLLVYGLGCLAVAATS